MSPSTIVILSSLLTYGAPLLLAVWELWSLRRRPPAGGNDPPPPEAPRPPKPLPDCLLPRPVTVTPKVRVLEDA